jgi:hypothetical protein
MIELVAREPGERLVERQPALAPAAAGEHLLRGSRENQSFGPG